MTNKERSANDLSPSWRQKRQNKRADSLRAMDEELERRMPARYDRQRVRRVLAVAGGACLGLLWVNAAVSWVLAPSDTAMIFNFVVLGILLVAGIPLAGQLIGITRGMTFKSEQELDERQLAGRLRAYSAAHRCTSVVMFLVLLVTMLVDRDGRDSQIPGAALFLILFAMLITHVLLPLIVAAWQMPDPPADEDEFGDEADEPARDTAP